MIKFINFDNPTEKKKINDCKYLAAIFTTPLDFSCLMKANNN